MTAEHGAIDTVVPLRWRDMDAYGHVNHAVYLTYLEQGRDAALTRLLRDAPGEVGYVVARVAIDYRRELRLADGPVVVSCRVTTVGDSSARTRERIVLPLVTIQQFALTKLRGETDLEDRELYEKLVIRCSFGIINAGRNSA